MNRSHEPPEALMNVRRRLNSKLSPLLEPEKPYLSTESSRLGGIDSIPEKQSQSPLGRASGKSRCLLHQNR
jgi:hypothetical protein